VLALRRRSFVFAAIVAAAGVCAPGCARRQAEPPPATMRIGLGVPRDPGRGTGSTFVIQALTTETWLAMLQDGRQAERLVTRWAWDDAHTTLTLTLRDDVYFHDGAKLTPEIAAKALRPSLLNGQLPSAASIKSVSVSGEHSVTVELTAPNAFLLPDMSLASVVLPTNDTIGTGPFQIESQTAEKTLFKAFPKYYRGAPGLSRIDLNIYPTQRNAWAALMRGDVDMLHEVSRDAVEFVQAETTVNSFSFPRPYYIPLVFNMRHPVLSRPEVRIAINEAVDRAAIVRDGMRGHGAPADGPIWPQHWAYTAGAGGFQFNPNQVRSRLDAAGVTLKPDADGTPKRFSFSCLMWGEDSRFDRLTVMVQKQLADVGIDMKIVPLTQKELVSRLGKGDFDAFIFEMAGRSLSWTYLFWRSGQGLNGSGYTAADAVLDRMRAGKSEEEIRAASADLTRILHENPPAAFLVWQETSRAVSTSFDVAAEKNRDIFTEIWQWRRTRDARKLTGP
jgi:peptide/nickel transport system substrate-binding protein